MGGSRSDTRHRGRCRSRPAPRARWGDAPKPVWGFAGNRALRRHTNAITQERQTYFAGLLARAHAAAHALPNSERLRRALPAITLGVARSERLSETKRKGTFEQVSGGVTLKCRVLATCGLADVVLSRAPAGLPTSCFRARLVPELNWCLASLSLSRARARAAPVSTVVACYSPHCIGAREVE
jgi:hypothetical protein